MTSQDIDAGDPIFESRVERINMESKSEDAAKLRVGLILTRTESRYGAGTIETIAQASGQYKTTALYNRRRFYVFVKRWLGHGARRRWLEVPLSMTHVIKALEKSDDFESTVDALENAAGGVLAPASFEPDPLIADLGLAPPLSVSEFEAYLIKRNGGDDPPAKGFDKSGEIWQLLTMAAKIVTANPKRRARLVIHWLDEGDR